MRDGRRIGGALKKLREAYMSAAAIYAQTRAPRMCSYQYDLGFPVGIAAE